MDDYKEVLDNHGPRSHFVKIIYKLRVLGWVLFFITFIYLLLHHAYSTLVPKPTLVVNEDGKLIGQIDYLSDMYRSKKQFVNAGKSFTGHYFSYNSMTIFDDVEAMLSFLSPELHEKEFATIADNPKYYKIHKAGVRSKVTWKKPVVLEIDPTNAVIQYLGTIKISGKNERSFDFKFIVKMRAVLRSDKNTRGVEVFYYEET